MKRHQVVLQGNRGAAQSALQAANLGNAPFQSLDRIGRRQLRLPTNQLAREAQ